MSSDPVHHPIQQAIEDIWAAGHTPRVQVDARRDDVVLPESVKTRWGSRLVLDLDAAWPLNLAYGEKGIEVDLAFQGHVTRCTLPWAAIYVVLDRVTGRGIVVESHLPQGEEPDVAPPRPMPRAVESKPTKAKVPQLEAVGPNRVEPKRVELKSSEPKRVELKSAEPKPAAPKPTDEVVEAAGATSDDEAKKRRARFKVIDGGR